MSCTPRAVAEKADELNQLRVLLREEAELYGDDYERSRNSSTQSQRITELEESLENVRVLLSEANRDLEDTTKNYDITTKKRQDADSDLLRYSNKLRRQESTLEKQKEEIRVLQEDVNRLRDKYDDAKDRSRDHKNDLSTQHDTIVEREGTIQDLRLHTDRLKTDRNEAEEAATRVKEEVANQAAQRAADEAKSALGRLRAEDIARADEIARIRSDAATSVLTIENLRRQLDTVTRDTQARAQANQDQLN